MTTQEKINMCAALDTEIRWLLNNWINSKDVAGVPEKDCSMVVLAVLVTTIIEVAEDSGVSEKQLMEKMTMAFSVATALASRTDEEVH